MGDCHSKIKRSQVKHQDQSITIPLQAMRPQELSLINLIYEDLASRSKTKMIDQQIFCQFFQFYGLWSQQIFKAFDYDQSAQINQQKFKRGFQFLVGGDFSFKVRKLFEFYDLDHSGGISYSQLIKMLYSYTKQDLKVILMNQNFLATISQCHLLHFFRPLNPVIDDIVIEKDSYQKIQLLGRVKSQSSSIHQQQVLAQNKIFYDKLLQSLKSQKSQQSFQLNEKIKKVTDKQIEKNKSFIDYLQELPVRNKSTPQFTEYIRKNLKINNNISSLIKKFTKYIFTEFHLDYKNSQINLKQFEEIMRRNQSLLNVYVDGFHQICWKYDEKSGYEFQTIKPCYQSQTIQVYNSQTAKKYIKLLDTTLFIFKSENQLLPTQLKCMQGLIVRQIGDQRGLGICIYHKDGIYPQKKYYFKEKSILQGWSAALAQFKQNSIHKKYQIIQKIGYGGFSQVYRGLNKQLNKEVAIKVINKYKLQKNQKQVIKHEKNIIRLCHHPNIIKYYEDFDTKSQIFIVTQLLIAGNLHSYINKKVFLQQYQAAVVTKQIVEGVMSMHQKGLIHRDIKPENILIVVNQQKKCIQRIKIIDFGLAVYKESLPNLDKAHKFAGTFDFMPPEMYLEQQYNESVDVFSIGVILYFMLSGELPFSSPFPSAIKQKTIECKIELQSNHWSKISVEGKSLLRKMLTKNKDRITTEQILKDPWLTDTEELKKYIGKNKKFKYVI